MYGRPGARSNRVFGHPNRLLRTTKNGFKLDGFHGAAMLLIFPYEPMGDSRHFPTALRAL